MWRHTAQWVAKRFPLPLLLHPFQIFLSALCVVAGLPFLLGFTPEPGSLESLLPSWLVLWWGGNLVVGGGLSFVGVAFGLKVVERLGLALLAPAAFIYGGGILIDAGAQAFIGGAIILAFGMACFIRLAVLTVSRSIVIARVAEVDE